MRSSDRLGLPFDSGSTEEYRSNHDVVLTLIESGPGNFQLPHHRATAGTEFDRQEILPRAQE
jgi:hypothetical protein